MQALARAAGGFRVVRAGPSARTGFRCMASSAAAPPAAKYMLLEYKYVSDILEKRGPYRAGHLAGAQVQADAGKIVLGGAVGETPEGALFIWKNATKEEIQAFIAEDPYVKAGLVPSWTIKPYAVAVQQS